MQFRISLSARRWLALAPLLAVIGGLFGGGLLLALRDSLGYFAPLAESGFTLRHYTALWNDREFEAARWLTLRVATATTLLSACGGTILALQIHRQTYQRRLVALLQIPLATPHLVIAGVLIQLISPSGLLARAAYALGVISVPADFPALLNDRAGIGIVLAFTLKEIPFVALMVLALLTRLGDTYEQVARTLGASAWQRLRYVTLPLLAPAILSASVLVFAFVAGSFELPYALGRPYPAMLAVVAQRRYLDINLAERPAAIALAVSLLCLTTLSVWLYSRLSRPLSSNPNQPSL